MAKVPYKCIKALKTEKKHIPIRSIRIFGEFSKHMSGIAELDDYCSKAINSQIETARIEIKACLDVSNEKFEAEFIQSISAIANTVPDKIVPYGLLIVGVHEAHVMENVEDWLKDDSEYQNLMRKHCDPPIKFNFYTRELEGKKFGVFVIENEQNRPHFVKENLIVNGRVALARGQIYVRNGSETVVALKTEFDEHIIFDFKRRIKYSLDELSIKDNDIFQDQIVPYNSNLDARTLDTLKLTLLKNINKVRNILRGAY